MRTTLPRRQGSRDLCVTQRIARTGGVFRREALLSHIMSAPPALRSSHPLKTVTDFLCVQARFKSGTASSCSDIFVKAARSTRNRGWISSRQCFAARESPTPRLCVVKLEPGIVNESRTPLLTGNSKREPGRRKRADPKKPFTRSAI